jgi:exoribonuclease R
MKSASGANRVKAQLLKALGKSKEDNLTNEEQVELAYRKEVGEYEEKVATLEAALAAAQAQAADLAAKLEEISSMQEEGESVEAGYHPDDMDKMEMMDEVELAMTDMPDEMRKSILSMPKEQVAVFAKAFKAQRQEVLKAAEEIRKERDIRLDAEAVAKSKARYPHVGIDHAAVAPALRRLAQTDAPLAKAVEEVLAAADGQLEESGLLREMGTSSTSSPSVLDEATALARSLVENGTEKTIEQAIERVLDSNPDLAKRYYMEAGR